MNPDSGAGAARRAQAKPAQRRAEHVSERDRAEASLQRKTRALLTLSACHHALVRAATEEALLQGVCQAIAYVGGYPLAWVGYAEHDGAKTIRPVAHSGDGHYLAGIRVSWADAPEGRGPAGTAIRTGQPCAVQNMRMAPSFAPWRAAALAHGYEATLALPLSVSGQVIGMLAMYAPEADAFDAEETHLLMQLAGDLAYGIAALRTRAEHTRIEAALRHSEERYRRIVDSAQEGIWETDAEGRTTYVNRKMADLLGYTPEEMRGTSFLAYFDVDDLGAARARQERRRQTGREAERYEVRLRRKDGAALWALSAITAFTDAEGRYTGSVALVTDLTERRQAEESNARLAAIVASSNDAITGSTLDGVLTSWNPAAERLYGYTAQEIVGRSASTLIPPDRSGELATILSQIRRSERIDAYETVRMHRDGHPVDVSLSISPVRDAAGAVIGVAAIARDIGARKQAEAALRARARQQAAVAALGVEALAERDFTVVFDRAVRLVAETLEVEYCNVLELVPGGNAVVLRAGVGWKEGLLGRATVGIGLDSQAGYTLASQEPVMVEDLRTETRFSGPPLLRDHGIVSGVSVVIHGTDGPFGVLGAHTSARRAFTQDDVHFLQAVANVLSAAIERAGADEVRRRSAGLEEQNRRIAEASRLKSDFLANMSHELRTPLNAIMGFAELLHDGKIGPVSRDQQEFLGDILTSSRHLLQIINDILDLSKVESGKAEFRPEPVDPAQVVAEVCAVVRTLAAHKRLRITSAIDPALGPLVLDPARLKQVLYNYLSNAIKFSGTGATITISITAEDADRFRLAVRDTGIGISPEDQARLFTEFEQLGAGIAAPEPGTGLGLALTRRVVEAQGGRVGVTSAVGEGSLFYAVLPRVAQASRSVSQGRA